ncbi:uncharacterized protein LOC132753501 isoform X2 [Ruditapes philippinarum]|nr:uncharacterized protein LOC132753501 isoform X2 [Ruditapes philippinarum]
MKTNFTSVLYDTATLNFTALAYPEPGMNGFVWHKQNSFTWIPLLSNADVVILSSGLHTRLTIKNVSRSDFGHYRVTVTNEIGKYEQYIFLTETGQQKTPTETILPSKKTLESTGLIISVTLGILFVTVTIYAISMSIYFKRKLILLDAQTSTQPSQRAYANLSFQTVNTDEDYSRPSTNDTAAVTNDNEYSVQNYTDLHHLSNDNQRTYDVIQKT